MTDDARYWLTNRGWASVLAATWPDNDEPKGERP